MITFHALSAPGKSEPEAWDMYYAAALAAGSGRVHACELADQGIEARRDRYAQIGDTDPAPPPSGPSRFLCMGCDAPIKGTPRLYCENCNPMPGQVR
jgi:hypothetical protein